MQKKVAVFGRKFDPSVSESVAHFIEKLFDWDCQVYFYKSFYELVCPYFNLQIQNAQTFNDPTEINKDFSFFFCLGGDGTFLEAVRFVRQSGVPIIGINIGRLGFLANIQRQDIEHSLKALFTNQFTLEERSLIHFEAPNNPFAEFPFAFNEITVQKHDASLITIEAKINGQELNTYWADGLIISTPTGSTAYSMSAGGPIVAPECPVLIISPIASHNLTVRPIVISNSHEISIKVYSRSNTFLVTLDSLSHVLTAETLLNIALASFKVKLVQLPGHEFFSTIRKKLMWGADIRN